MQPDGNDGEVALGHAQYGRTVTRLVSSVTLNGYLDDETLRLAVERATQVIG